MFKNAFETLILAAIGVFITLSIVIFALWISPATIGFCRTVC